MNDANKTPDAHKISMREMRAQALSATFDRVVWLDAAAISAIFAGAAKSLAESRSLRVAVGLFAASLVITLIVPVWRAWVNAKHVEENVYRVAWEIYLAQLIAAGLTGLGVICAIAALL